MHHARTKPEKGIGIVVCSPLAEEKLNSHRIIYNLAQELTGDGYSCLRFDYYGSGDSEGEFEDLTITTMVNNTLASIDQFDEGKYPSICLIGFRLGGVIAALAADNNDRIKNIILINPIVDIGKYINECIRGNLSSQVMLHNKVIKNTNELLKDIKQGKKVNYHGYEMTKSFYDEAMKINLVESIKKLNINIMNIEIKMRKTNVKNKTSPIENKNVQYRTISGIQCWKEAKYYNDKDDELNKEITLWLNETVSNEGKNAIR